MDVSKFFSLHGKHILVTGAAGHVGRELCAHLVADGCTVFAVDRDTDALARHVAAIDRDQSAILPMACDLGEESQRTGLVDQLNKATSHLDGVVHAAAFVGTSELPGWAVKLSKQSIDTWRQAIEVNLTAPFHLSQLLEPLLRAGSEPAIVNVSSIYGSIAPDWRLYDGTEMGNPAAYAASKGGLEQLTRWLASSLAPDIRVNAVSPGGLLRGQPAVFEERYREKTPLRRMGSEQDAVGAIIFLLSSAASYVTGETIFVDGGYRVV